MYVRITCGGFSMYRYANLTPKYSNSKGMCHDTSNSIQVFTYATKTAN